jgi:hypothetical protein
MNIRIELPTQRIASPPVDAPSPVASVTTPAAAGIVQRRHSGVARYFRKARERQAATAPANAVVMTPLADGATDASVRSSVDAPSVTKRALQAAENEGWK